MTIRRGQTSCLVPENEDEVRMELVHELRQRIAAGGYAVAGKVVAERMVDEALVYRD